MKLIRTLYISALVFGGVLQSCSVDLPIDLESSYTRLVVEGVVTTDTTSQFIRLANSANYFYNKPLEPVKNALVQITDGTDTFILTENPDKPGYYFTDSDFFGVPGKTYSLSINNVDIDGDGNFEEYTASSYLKDVVQPDSIKVVTSNNSFTDYEVRYFGQEPGETHDYYLFKLRRNGVMLTDTITETYPSDDFFYNGILLKNIGVYNLFKTKQDEDIQPGDTITLEISNITKEYNQFLLDLMLESHGSDPFGGQPANVSTNIKDETKAIGFFTAYSIKRSDYIVKASDLIKK